MKIMINEKAAKLAEELSEVVAVEDGNIQVGKNLEVDGDLEINGEIISDVNTEYNFTKTFVAEDFEQPGRNVINLPSGCLLKSFVVYTENIDGTNLETHYELKTFYVGEHFAAYDISGNSYYRVFGNIVFDCDTFTFLFNAYIMGATDEENFIELGLESGSLVNKKLKISVSYITNVNNRLEL